MKIPKLTALRYAVTAACTRLPPAYHLEISYPYMATVSETGITVHFTDFPDIGTGNVYEDIHTVAHRSLGQALDRVFAANTMIPLPSPALEDQELAKLPEYVALVILRRNWAVAQTYAEARNQFDEQQQQAIRKAQRHKGTDSDSDQTQVA